jgi:hypothetical protein
MELRAAMQPARKRYGCLCSHHHDETGERMLTNVPEHPSAGRTPS